MATKSWKPARVRSEEDRGSGSGNYIQLKDGEKFVGVALFDADPKIDDPAYFEFKQHWIDKSSCPCPGPDVCPYCEDGDRARSTAKSVWLVSRNEDGKVLDPPELRMFNLNYNMIKAFTEMREEGDKIKGREFRVSRLDDRGNYAINIKSSTKPMTVAEVKTALKDGPDLEALITSQLRKAMEGVALARAVEDDDDDEPNDEPKAKKGAAAKKAKPKDEPADWPDELDEVEVTVVKVDKTGNFVTVSHEDYEDTKDVYTTDDIEFDLKDLSKGDTVTVTTGEQDGDGDYILTAEPETDTEPEAEPDEDPDEASGLPDSIEGDVFEVTEVDASESTMEVKSDELDIEFTLYFLDTMDIDFDDFEPGTKITVTAEKDSQGDLVATELPEIQKAKGAKKAPVAKKGAKGKS